MTLEQIVVTHKKIGRPSMQVVCTNTGERGQMRDFAERIAVVRGSNALTERKCIQKAVAQSRPYRGLSFVKWA